MKKLVVMLALLSILSIPVEAQDGLNPTSEQLDQALQHMKKQGFDTSKLPKKDELQKLLSGEDGRRVREMAKKVQEQNPEQVQQMQQKILQRFDKNGDGTLGPRERELAQQAFQQRQGDGSDSGQSERPQSGDRVLDCFDHNDDGQLGPRERGTANEAQQQQQSDDQNVIRLKRRSDESQSHRPDTAKRDDSRRNDAPQQASDSGPRPDGASANRSSRPDGQQGQPPRTNNDSRQPHPHQMSNSNGPPTNQSASGHGSRSAGGEHRGGASRGGGAPRGHR